MKILQLCKKFPWPLKDGESVAVNAISKGLADQGVIMDLLAMNTTRHFTTVDSEVIRAMPHYRTVKWVPVDTDLRIHEAVRSLLEGSSYHLKRFRDVHFEQAVRKMIQQAKSPYDFILLESLYVMPYIDTIRELTDAKIILRSHNLEWEIWDRLASNNKNPAWQWYLRKLSRKLKEYEVAKIKEVEYLLPISPVDRMKYERMGYTGELYTLPMGIELEKYPVTGLSSHEYFDIAFIGSLDWRPNLEGLLWFMKKVWPQVRRDFGGRFRIHIAGRNMPRKIARLNAEDVVIHGEVNDAIDFMKKYEYFVVPLFSGSGMRVKILEAMAMGKIVLSTKVGIEGIPAAAEKEYIEVNNQEAFMTAFQKIASGEYPREILSRNARSFIEDNYAIESVSTKFYDFLSSILKDSLQRVE